MFTLFVLFVFAWLFVKSVGLAFHVTWGLAKFVATLLFVIALPLLVVFAVVGAGHGAFVLNFFNALGGYRFQQLTGFFAGQAQLLAGKLVAVFIFFGGCTSHVRPRFLVIDKSVAHFPVCRKGFDRELLHFAREIAIIYSVNLYATEGFSHELDR